MLEYLERVSGAPPPIVYHYTTQEGFRSILHTKTIWASNALYLSDSSEINYGIDVVNDVLDRRLAAAATHDVARWNEVTTGRRDSSIYVAAFSAERDDLSQWQAYGGRSGYCLAFETATLDLIRHVAEPVGFFLRCLYSEAEQRAAAAELFDLLEPAFASMTPDQIRSVFNELLTMTAACVKHPSFQAEREWRLVFLAPAQSSLKQEFRSGRTFLIPYVAVPIVISGTNPRLSEVLVGPTPHPELAGPAAWNACMAHGWDVDKDRSTSEARRARSGQAP
jgi:hypothetical protein